MVGQTGKKHNPVLKSADTDDPVKSFERWKKKYTRKKDRIRFRKKQTKKPDWQIEKEIINKLTQKYQEINLNEIVKFSDFPLSKKTLQGLLEAQYRKPTEIQKQTIGLALQGKDILGAAKTGSGKTLAFLIPVLECLYRQQWISDDGLGVLIISPTRELAYQTFEVLRKIGKRHEFSAGLIIGGKDLKDETEKIHRTNIIICTPGRLLQHMDQTCSFYASNLQMLVLDEADRILDMGFADTMNAIIENLPRTRQTLLFSATQTKSVKDLARLSLKDPEYVWVHERAKFSTPGTLEQNYVVCELHQKLNMLYSFLKNHLTKKSIVFFSSCKEVQYLFRVFCRLRPGISVLALHGKQQQMKRMEVYDDFIRKKAAVLFATDIAARGLDFPAVNWVLQLDCPEDANTYIHRVGRTARYKEGGEALLVLLPSEEKGMVRQLEERKVPINKIKVNPDKLTSIQKNLEAFLAQEQELKERAQRCFVSYIRSVYLMKNKDIFDVFKLPVAEYALSLGLAVPPRIRFLQKIQKQHGMIVGREEEQETTKEASDQSGEDGSSDVGEELESFKAQVMKQKAKGGEIVEKTNSDESEGDLCETSEEEEDEQEQSVEDSDEGHNSTPKNGGQSGLVVVGFLNEDDEDDDKDLDLLTVKRRNVFGLESKADPKNDPDELASKPPKPGKESKVKEAKKLLKRKFKVNSKIIFTDEGEGIQQWPPVQKTTLKDEDEEDESGGIELEKARERLQEEDKFDKEEYRKKVKEKHREKRLKEKAARKAASKRQEVAEEESVAYLDHSDNEDEFDPSTLPDPDKHKGSDLEGDEDNKESDRGDCTSVD
ncbi:probable ATP-dependent RNA helicase DDX10 isoform X2 [Latimeria chalumnae]|uniref:probable ATP-dependent RNA helicase DDX10 isoform X2 n=1 Tax=Latimeria chalumnae TaxID=7897 RepID=UPI00313CE2E3